MINRENTEYRKFKEEYDKRMYDEKYMTFLNWHERALKKGHKIWTDRNGKKRQHSHDIRRLYYLLKNRESLFQIVC